MLTYFQNCTTDRFSTKLSKYLLEGIPPHLNYVATLPCEILRIISRRHTKCCANCVVLVVSCPGRRWAPRLDESFVQGLLGAEFAMHSYLVRLVGRFVVAVTSFIEPG